MENTLKNKKETENKIKIIKKQLKIRQKINNNNIKTKKIKNKKLKT